MNIYINGGRGYGRTLLSAFDAALVDAGINYNLITLSSFIPPYTTILLEKFVPTKDEFGYKLYVVKAAIQSQEAGKFIGAALGWYQLEEDGRGIFVEHEAEGKTEEEVEKTLKNDVNTSLIDLCRLRGYPIKEEMKIKTSVVEVKDTPASAVVVAVYQSEPWK